MRKVVDLKGMVFGEWTVLERAEVSSSVATLWKCQCSCGKIDNRDASNLKRGRTKSCGCLNTKDLIGLRFGRLRVQAKCEAPKNKNGFLWLCLCDCGNPTSVVGYSLREGITQSCGCIQREAAATFNKTHGLSKTPEYHIWNAMITRCKNNHPSYGGRGIQVCKRWRESFQAFWDDMGPRPEGSTLDREDNDGDYEPSNCRWVDQTVQILNQNKRMDNTTGYTGVNSNGHGRFQARLRIYGINVLNKEFDTLEEAVAARKEAEEKYKKPLVGNKEGQ